MGFLLAFIIGAAVVTIIFVLLMQQKMLLRHSLPGHSFDEVNAALKEIVPEVKGWGFPLENWHFSQMLQSKGLQCDNIKNVMIHFVCNANHACAMLGYSPVFSGMMPCSWAIIEEANGNVFVAKMNVGLMSKMYFGKVGAIMREVVKAEEIMMEKLEAKLNAK